MKAKIYRICKDNPLPTQANPDDAGWDVYASEDVEFSRPGQIKLVPLGIIVQAPKGYHFKLCIRSSVAHDKHFTQPNAPGVIDSKFAGPNDEIKIMLKSPDNQFGYSDYSRPRIIKKGDRVGQLILEKNNDIEWDEQDDRDFAGENRGGFGSTGER